MSHRVNGYGTGFEAGDTACCGVANIEAGILCNSFSLKICQNATKYVFWDSIHPTERTYNMLVTSIIGKNVDKFAWKYFSFWA